MPTARNRLLVVAGLLLMGAACHGRGTRDRATTPAPAFAGLDGSRFVWVEAECSDGPLQLGSVGLDRELRLDLVGGSLVMTLDTELAAQGCASTAVFAVKPASRGAQWHFEPQALVTLPADQKCGPSEREAVDGSLRMFGDQLEVVMQRSPWCRGFDAHFVYRRADWKRLDERQLVMHYIAAFQRGDATAVAGLFVDSGSLVEPFTKTDDGNYARHDGRDAVRRWYAAAFASTPWHALRLTAIEQGGAPGQLIASWDYMDPQLAEPLRGRNLFVIAGGEIYESELQLIDEPKPKPLASADDVAAKAQPKDAP
jgi:hypothetical protein